MRKDQFSVQKEDREREKGKGKKKSTHSLSGARINEVLSLK